LRYEKWYRDWKSALTENFFLKVLLLILSIGFVLNASIFKKKDRIVLVPPKIEKEVWVEKDRVSPEYLEQMAVFISTLAGNLAPVNALYSVKVLEGYILPKVYAEIKTDLAAQAEYIKRNNIQQSFFPETVKITGDNEVTIEGNVLRYIGSTKVSNERMLYRIKFKPENYKLYVEELNADYPEKIKRQLMEKGVISSEDQAKNKK
jgi:conjugal transfer pilus assembly protein TraE